MQHYSKVRHFIKIPYRSHIVTSKVTSKEKRIYTFNVLLLILLPFLLLLFSSGFRHFFLGSYQILTKKDTPSGRPRLTSFIKSLCPKVEHYKVCVAGRRSQVLLPFLSCTIFKWYIHLRNQGETVYSQNKYKVTGLCSGVNLIYVSSTLCIRDRTVDEGLLSRYSIFPLHRETKNTRQTHNLWKVSSTVLW